MKILKKTLVAAGIATAVSATGAAQAATITNDASTDVPATFADTIVNEASSNTVDLGALGGGAEFILQMGALEALAEEDSITLELSNGARWGAITAASVIIGGNASVPASVALVAGGPGSTSATFRVTAAGVAANSALGLDPATASLNMSAVPDNGTVTITASMSGFVGGVATSLYGSPLTFNAVSSAPARVATVTAATAGVFSVATGFTTLASGGLSANTSANATITVTDSLFAVANGHTTGVPAAGPTVTNNFVTISGPMTGVASITGANAATSVGAAAAPAAASFALDTAADAAYGLLNASPATVNIVFDGSVAYDASSYTAAVATTLDAAGYAANADIGSGTIASFTRNGSSFTTNSFGSLNKMTVTDLSGAVGAGGADGAIAITAFAADGTAVTCTGLTVANLAANGTTTIQGADVLAACAGAKRIDGIVNSTSIQTTNTKITADGATSQSGVNASTAISN